MQRKIVSDKKAVDVSLKPSDAVPIVAFSVAIFT